LSYQILPNIIFICAVLGVLLLILRRLPEAAAQGEQELPELPADQKLLAKGLPAVALSKSKMFLKFWVKKIWNFVLEAKDLRPSAATGYRMKKMFSHALPAFKTPPTLQAPPITTHDVKSEQYYLDMIKLQPKNLSNYDALGKFYLSQSNFTDAGDIYEYLASHQSGNAEYQARLGYCFYLGKQFEKAAASYQKSLALDSTQPNRYYNLGLSLEAAGNLGDAAKSFEQAINLEPKNSKYYISLSTAYIRLGRKEQAKVVLQTAQGFDPENENIKAKMARFI
jgi:tetratricopeptide (TPR) repeat protein